MVAKTQDKEQSDGRVLNGPETQLRIHHSRDPVDQSCGGFSLPYWLGRDHRTSQGCLVAGFGGGNAGARHKRLPGDAALG